MQLIAANTLCNFKISNYLLATNLREK